MKSKLGFSLVEIIVVVSIVAILASVSFVGISKSGQKSRDIDRQADLRTLQSAVELYKQKNGRYPAGCRGANQWSGEVGTSYACASGSQYIIGLAPAFISALPRDPKLNGVNSGYAYYTNAAGTAFKIIVYRTAESEVVDPYKHPFSPCDITDSSAGVCDQTYFAGNSIAPNCDSTDSRISYAVWGGYPPEPFTSGIRIEEQVENVICRMP